ncbi:MAG: XdhC family protein [Pseudomonadota bacterium]
MHVDTEKVARRAHAWYRAGIPTWWVTVLTTFGSSPAPVGSTLAVNESEACVGGIGMPNIDQAVIRRVLAHTPSEPVVWSLGDQMDSAGALGLPVGADPVVVQVEPLTDARADGLAVLADMLSQRQSAERRVDSGEVVSATPFAPVIDRDHNTVVHHPPWRLVMTSVTPLTVELCERTASLGFDCVVLEPREAFHALWPRQSVLAHCRVHTGAVPDAVAATALDARTAALALAHDPALDDPLLLASLDAPVFLIGALGSRANHAGRLGRLTDAGADPDRLPRIQGPVGVDIGSKTPAEIAVSVLGSLIAARSALG